MDQPTPPAELLRRAEQLLSGHIVAAEGNSARLAAVLARQALEMTIVERCRAVGADIEFATMRSQLVVLRALDQPDVASGAATAWRVLSGACHRHAFELAPSVSEVRAMCESVVSIFSQPAP